LLYTLYYVRSNGSVAVTISSDDPKQDINVIVPFTGLPEGLTIGTHVVLHLALVVK